MSLTLLFMMPIKGDLGTVKLSYCRQQEMASTVIFSCQIPQQTICSKIASSIKPGYMPFKRSSQKNTKIQQYQIGFRRQTRRCKFPVPSASDSEDITLNQLSAASLIKQFFACINEKKLKELDEYISDDCCFEDCSFVSPLQGKKVVSLSFPPNYKTCISYFLQETLTNHNELLQEIMHFYQLLTTGMGHNVKFNIEHVCEDDEFTAGVNWHMEWKTRQIPFTRGCSFYECSQEGDRLVIKKARVVVESPIKPGGMVLVLLKNVTGMFDDFPKFADWFLKSPHVIVQFFMKIYSRLYAPIINPLLSGYIRIWNFVARLFALALNILLHIHKKYFQ
ncbi:uncharacterized protein LOC105645764 [Jatropha curcas]|uniref:uncharacterized protein LOC105645764 n=1 Tax=Jatropha curcas TaxID=180498 RepID=UPI0009D6EBA8|nr:uncharacterized protein LOC105645764 [Jatropha curcas]